MYHKKKNLLNNLPFKEKRNINIHSRYLRIYILKLYVWCRCLL